MVEHPQWSVFGCFCTMCMCLHNCHWLFSFKPGNVTKIWLKFTKKFYVVSSNNMWYVSSYQNKMESKKKTWNCTNSTASETNFQCDLLSVTLVCDNCCLLVASEEAGGSPQGRRVISTDFHFHAYRQSMKEETGHCSGAHLVNTWRLQGSASTRSSAYASTTGQAWRWPLPVACLEDGWGSGAEPGAPRLPAGTSLLGW